MVNKLQSSISRHVEAHSIRLVTIFSANTQEMKLYLCDVSKQRPLGLYTCSFPLKVWIHRSVHRLPFVELYKIWWNWGSARFWCVSWAGGSTGRINFFSSCHVTPLQCCSATPAVFFSDQKVCIAYVPAMKSTNFWSVVNFVQPLFSDVTCSFTKQQIFI